MGIDKQIDYDKFYLYSLITHSTAIEGSTITELRERIKSCSIREISLKGKSIAELHMNLDLKDAYEHAVRLADTHTDITVDLLKGFSALVLKNTGQEYKTALGDFSSARGELRLLNVTTGVGGKSYMNYSKVPAKLSEFPLNRERENHAAKSMTQLYEISFDAHYDLVTIHPWADGNGRMARLLMNMLQFEFGLIPTKILKEDKEEYIKALVETRENGDLNVFREFMTATMIKNLTHDIEVYRKSIDDTSISGEKPQKSREKKVKSREKIMALLSQDNTLSAAASRKTDRHNSQSGGKTDCQNESGRGAPTNRTGQGRILAGGRKKRLIFWRERSLPPAFFIAVSKKRPPIENQNSIRTGSFLLSVCCFFFCCIDFSVGRLFPLPSAFLVQT